MSSKYKYNRVHKEARNTLDEQKLLNTENTMRKCVYVQAIKKTSAGVKHVCVRRQLSITKQEILKKEYSINI